MRCQPSVGTVKCLKVGLAMLTALIRIGLRVVMQKSDVMYDGLHVARELF